MQDLNDLYYFAAVVEHGGFALAGRALIDYLAERMGKNAAAPRSFAPPPHFTARARKKTDTHT